MTKKTDTHIYTRACAHVCCCTNVSSTVHSLYNVLCFLDYELPYRAQYLQSTDCLLGPRSTATGNSCLSPVRVVKVP